MGNNCILPDTKEGEKIFVGYGPSWLNTIMILISIFGIIINSIFVFNYLKSIISTKNQSNSGISAVEKMLCMIAGVETFISICWLLNNVFIHDSIILKQRCSLCSTIAHFEIFLYLFDWMILSTSLYQIKIILINPQQILESGKRVVKFVIFSFCFSLISFVFSILAKFGGVSPMLTCFISIENLEPYQTAFFWIFFTIPIFCFSFGGYQIYLIMTSSQYKTEKKNRQLFREYSYFVITYIIFSIILIFSYIFAKLDFMINGFQAVFTLISCSNPLIVGIIRIFRTGLVKRLLKRKKKNSINDENENLIEQEKEEENPIYALEKKILENLIIKYFTAISFALGKSKYKEEDEKVEILDKEGAPKFDENEHKEYKITKPEILKDLDLAINEDIKILEESNFDINITEYNSSTFKKLRELEGLNEDLIISMFQPKKGTNQLINMVNETLYINSTNKLLMLKKVKREQLLFFQRNILGDLYQHLVNHPHSIICRVFGLYKIKIDQEAEENYMALMYNTNDSLENINDITFIKPKNMIRQMKISQEDLNNIISIDSTSNDSKLRASNTIYSAVTFNSSLVVEGKTGGVADTNKRSFRLKIPGVEEQKLTEIISQDAEFLKKKGISSYSFLIFERNVDGKENSCLFKNEEKGDDKENKIQIGDNVFPKIKKYIFNSSLENVIYSICILNYYRSKS
jgi:hypothetical protein